MESRYMESCYIESAHVIPFTWKITLHFKLFISIEKISIHHNLKKKNQKAEFPKDIENHFQGNRVQLQLENTRHGNGE